MSKSNRTNPTEQGFLPPPMLFARWIFQVRALCAEWAWMDSFRSPVAEIDRICTVTARRARSRIPFCLLSFRSCCARVPLRNQTWYECLAFSNWYESCFCFVLLKLKARLWLRVAGGSGFQLRTLP